jgi:hypothetical protein
MPETGAGVRRITINLSERACPSRWISALRGGADYHLEVDEGADCSADARKDKVRYKPGYLLGCRLLRLSYRHVVSTYNLNGYLENT